MANDLIILTRPFLSSTDSDGIVSGRRVSSIRYIVNSTKFNFIDEPLRASIPRRVKTLHALLLRP